MAKSDVLGTPLTHQDVIEWRLHWLTCKLGDVYSTTLKELAYSPPKLKALDVAVKIQAIQNQYGRIIWEHKTMLNLDYDDEILLPIYELPKYKAYFEALCRMKELVRSMAEGEGRQILRDAMTSMKGSFYVEMTG